MAAMGALEKEVQAQSYQGLMQTLASDGHWFLERTQNLSESSLLRQDLHQRFHKLDSLKNDLTDALAAQAQRNQLYWYMAWLAIFGSAFFLARNIYRTYRALRQQNKLWQGIELDAAEELKNGTPWPVLKIERLMHQVLKALPLAKLEQLWSSFFADWAAGKVDLRQCTAARLALPPASLDWYESLPAANQAEGQGKISPTARQLTAALPSIEDVAAPLPPLQPLPAQAIGATLAAQGVFIENNLAEEDEDYAQDAQNELAMNGHQPTLVDLHDLILKMLGRLTPRFFAQGVRLKFASMAQGFYWGNKEEAAQFLYSVFDYALAVCADVDLAHKVLKVESALENEPVTVKVASPGMILKLDLPSVLHPGSPEYAEGQKAAQILAAVGTSLGIDVTWSYTETTTLRLNFPPVVDPAAHLARKRLARLVKGKKKDVQASLAV